jgi:hypothetical protein
VALQDGKMGLARRRKETLSRRCGCKEDKGGRRLVDSTSVPTGRCRPMAISVSER